MKFSRIVLAIVLAGGLGTIALADIGWADEVRFFGKQSGFRTRSFLDDTHNQSGLSAELIADNLTSITHTNGFVAGMMHLTQGTKRQPLSATFAYLWETPLTNTLATIAVWNYSQVDEPNRSATSVIISIDTGDGYTTVTNLPLTQNDGTAPVVADLLDVSDFNFKGVVGIKLALVQDKLDTHNEYMTGLSEVAFLFEGTVEKYDLMVDPRFPFEQQPLPPDRWSRWPLVRIRQLEAERSQLLEKIAVLPQYDPISPMDRLGYHSLFEKPGVDGSLPLHSIDFTFKRWKQSLDSLAMVPAFNPKEPRSYAFPKRFKVEVRASGAKRFECVVDWMDKDFPDPGPYPVFFSDINRVVKQVRITVQPSVQKSGVAYYALGEVYLFRQKEDGQVADNMAIWGHTGVDVTVSDAFSMPPLWDASYLYDDYTNLGFPLGGKPEGLEDLMITFDETSLSSEPVQFTLDLGRVKDIGRIDFWPADAPYLLALPSFGFPAKVSVEMSKNSDFKPAKIIETEHAGRRVCRDNLLTLLGEGYDAQYLRITMEELSTYKGKRILGLGEISVSEFGEVLSTNCTVTAQGIPAVYRDQLPRLVDGYSRQRRILPQAEWIKGLAQRRPLDRRFAVVERELDLAWATWRTIKLRSGIFGGVIIVAGLIAWVVIQRWIRKRGTNKLKWRIARDLHDDVGSNLGSISLAAEQLKHVVVDAGAQENLRDLSLLAREACVSLREIVWVIDESTIRLPLLIQKLVERAERILSGAELFVETVKDCPDCVVSLTFKRHLIMFFKEVVHNCALHARATQVWVGFSIVDHHLQLSVRDNGCGFDPSESSDGWGLVSMKERAKEMGGEMELISRIGEGTTIMLKTPLETLSKEPSNAYITSN